MQAHLGQLRAGAAVEHGERVLVLADRQQGREVPQVLLEQVEHRGDPALAEPHPGPHALFLQLVRPGVGGLLEQRDPRLVPKLPAEQERGVGAERHLDGGGRLGGVPVAREALRADLQVQLQARAGGLGGDAVGVGEQPLRAVDGDPHVLTARGEDLVVERTVPVAGRQRAQVHVTLLQRRQDADHYQPGPGAAGLLVPGVEVVPDLLLKLGERVAGQLPGRHVDLQVELPHLDAPGRVRDRVEHVGVAHGRHGRRVDEVQLDLLAHPRRAVLEQALAQHPGERVKRAPYLLPVQPPVLAGELDRLNLTAHTAYIRTCRGQRQAPPPRPGWSGPAGQAGRSRAVSSRTHRPSRPRRCATNLSCSWAG